MHRSERLQLDPLAGLPALSSLASRRVPTCLSLTYTSCEPAPGTREIPDSNATNRPSALSAGSTESPACGPGEHDAPLTNWVTPVRRSWTNMSGDRLPSPCTRLLANDQNAT